MINLNKYSLRLVKEQGGRYDFENKKISSPETASRIIREVFEMEERAEEIFVMLTLDTKHQVTGLFLISQGTLNGTYVHPREIYKRALLNNAASIVIAHNHPSGDLTPSKEDIEITKRLYEVGKIIGIELLDHLILGSNSFTSFKKKGLI